MPRLAFAVAVLLLILLGVSPLAAQDTGPGLGDGSGGGDDPADRDPDIRYDGSTLSFAVGFQDQLTMTVSRDYTGIIARCAFYDADWDTVYIFPVVPYERDPRRGHHGNSAEALD